MAAKKTTEFMIVNRRSGKALQATGLENGLAVEQREPQKTDAQIWTSLEAEGGVKLMNKASGKVLDVMQGGVANGTWAQIWDDVNGDSQLWRFENVSSTYKKIINVHSGRALDVVDMSTEDGALAQIWDSVEGEGQQWKLVSAEEKPAAKAAPRKAAAKKAPAKEEKPAPQKAAAPAKKAPAKAEEPKAIKVEAPKAIKAEGPKAIKKQEAAPKAMTKAPAKKPAAKKGASGK